ncbi:MAG TPA: family 43 glycosylhydrolase [Armatimonadota bacterium]|nr:family 43 glycosylhydrolase [Armatimonadota bacterium]
MRFALFMMLALTSLGFARDKVLIPQIGSEWWIIAVSPDLGELTSDNQQPVDFAVWQASDGKWELWSCIRGTKCGGNTRLFYHWEGERLTDRDWKPMGIAMQADPKFGETAGGLQAPYVLKHDNRYYMFYGDWEHICLATSKDGKAFERRLIDGKTGMFTEGLGNNTRDPMVIRVGDKWHCYYTAYPGDKGAVYCRTSSDMVSWSESKVVAFGGSAGTGKFSAECPFVLKHDDYYYLFRTQHYGEDARTSVYRSTDPMDFGINDDKCLVCTLPVAAPEIIECQGKHYIACLLPSLKGIRIANLNWVEKP